MGAPFLGPGGGGLPPAILNIINNDAAVRAAVNSIANSSPTGAPHVEWVFNGIAADVPITATGIPATTLINSGFFLYGPPPGGSASWVVIMVAVCTVTSPGLSAQTVSVLFGPNGGVATEGTVILPAVSGEIATVTLALTSQVNTPTGGLSWAADLTAFSSLGTAVGKRSGLSGTGDYATAVVGLAFLQSGTLA